MLQPRFFYHKTQTRRQRGSRGPPLQNSQPDIVEMPATPTLRTQATKRGAPLSLAPVPKKRKAAAAPIRCILTDDPIRQLDTETVKQLRAELDEMFKDWSVPRSERRFCGRIVKVPRDQVVLSEDGKKTYFYGSGDLPRAVWPPEMQRLAATLSAEYDVDYNMILVNRYVNGQDGVGWHADDEKSIDQTAPIVSVSIGAPRCFRIRKTRMGDEHHERCMAPDHTTMQRKGNTIPKKVSAKMVPENGSYIVMPPGFQALHEHEVPKTTNKVGVRYNLTFRKSI